VVAMKMLLSPKTRIACGCASSRREKDKKGGEKLLFAGAVFFYRLDSCFVCLVYCFRSIC